jgi:hypothetical protein
LRHTLERLADAAALAVATIAHCDVTFGLVHQQLEKALFMPISLTWAALLARVTAVLTHLHKVISRVSAEIFLHIFINEVLFVSLSHGIVGR